ncbi:Protein RETICULATA-RELATED 4 chloroplastic [Bienertia sinuspersici]
MAIAAFSLLPSLSSPPFLSPRNNHKFPPIKQHLSITHSPKKFSLTHVKKSRLSSTQLFCNGDDSGGIHGGVSGGDGGGGGGNDGDGGGGGGNDGDGDAGEKNRGEALLVIAELGKSFDSLPKDLAMAVEAGRVPGSIIRRYFELEKSAVFRWLLQFGGFKERLLADDLFLTKVAIECGIGMFTKTAAELEKRKENFKKEIDFVIADVIMALVADFLLVWLPAPTISLRAPLKVNVAVAGTTYSFIQRIGALLRNGAKLFAVGTSSSVIGTGVTNMLIKARTTVDKSFSAEAEDIPMVATSIGYGVYLAISANLRYQVLAGVIEQRILEPLLHDRKLVLSALCFAVRTGNTFLGSLMWVDFARLIGVQRSRS